MHFTSRPLPRTLCAISWLLLLGSKDCEKQGAGDDAAYGAGASGAETAGSASGAGAAGRRGDHSGEPAAHAGRAAATGGTAAAGEAGSAGRDAGRAGAGGSSRAGAGAGGAGDSAAGSGGAGEAGASAALSCGTRGGVTCGDGEYCDYPTDSDCGATDRGGACRPQPDACPDNYEPVCGCDKHSYSSECDAHAVGVSVAHTALCTPDECTSVGGKVLTSDGASVPQCAADELQWNLSGGREQVICCLAKPARGKTCGGFAALECATSTQFCNYDTAAGGQGCDGKVADAGGVCQDKPAACTRDYRPVCGCDRRTYGNECSAHAEGASILHDGACTVSDCAAVSGTVAYGAGPGPMCPQGTTRYTDVIEDNGAIPTEGAYCCTK